LYCFPESVDVSVKVFRVIAFLVVVVVSCRLTRFVVLAFIRLYLSIHVNYLGFLTVINRLDMKEGLRKPKGMPQVTAGG